MSTTNKETDQMFLETGFSQEDWEFAVNQVELHDWNQGGARESAGDLAAWIAEGRDSKPFGNDIGKLEAAIEVAFPDGDGDLTPGRFLAILKSHRGETVSDFGTLADEYVRENYGEGALSLLDGKSADELEVWYFGNAVSSNEVCGEIAAGGFLHWFDANQW